MFIIGVSAQIVFIALVLFSDNFRVALLNLLKSNIIIINVAFNLVSFLLLAMDHIFLIIAPFALFLFLENKNKKL
uniref:hypothetical protein n=1 Tax=Lactococcus garvieae TaxID=1363 RepID=UPI001E52D3AB|nr:hypothetical protein [Lactococcus garvieae]